MDLGLNGLLAQTEANLTNDTASEMTIAASSLASPPMRKNLVESADALVYNESKTSSSTPTLPHVASASPSPVQQRPQTTTSSNNDNEDNGSPVSGSLADWKFDGTSSTDSSRPRTKQSRGDGQQGMRGSQSAATTLGRHEPSSPSSSMSASRTFDTHSSLSPGAFSLRGATNMHRPSTVSELTQPRQSLNNKSLKMSPFGVRSQRFITDAENIASDAMKLSSWLMKGGVQRATAELGMKMTELRTRTMKSFRREPGRPQQVAPHIQELRYNHYLLRRIEKIATILSRLNDKKERDMAQRNGTGTHSKKQKIAVTGVFEKTVSSERRRLAKIDKIRQKVVKVLDTDNVLLRKRRRQYNKKASIEQKRQEIVRRRVALQKRHLAARAKKKNKESKRARDHLAKKHEDALIKASENLRIREKEAVALKIKMDLAKLKVGHWFMCVFLFCFVVFFIGTLYLQHISTPHPPNLTGKRQGRQSGRTKSSDQRESEIVGDATKRQSGQRGGRIQN